MFSIQTLYRSFVTIIVSCIFLQGNSLLAQELYPLHEPASTLGKNTLGIRLFNESYKEVNQIRNMTGLRFMYGLTPKLTVLGTAIASNHHGSLYPSNYPFHNTPERGASYPMRLNGGHIYAKYRFFTKDKHKQHLRLAAYSEMTLVKTTHHESEPNLAMGDTKGWGLGLTSTYLYQKFAVSATLGYIHPWAQVGISKDEIDQLPDIEVTTNFGKTIAYNMSFGYLLFPKHYNNYRQTNVNLYLELHGKYYGDGQVDLMTNTPLAYTLHKSRYPAALRKGSYLDISPSIQVIINSNLRLDATMTLPLLGKSWAKLYPLYTIAAQYYFYL